METVNDDRQMQLPQTTIWHLSVGRGAATLRWGQAITLEPIAIGCFDACVAAMRLLEDNPNDHYYLLPARS